MLRAMCNLRIVRCCRRIGTIRPCSRHLALVLLLLLISHLGCWGSKKYEYTVPIAANDGWQTASLESEKLAAKPIKELIERINHNIYKNIHSVLVVKNGKLVVDEYFPGYDSNGIYREFDRDTLHEMHSTTKSVNSILIGIAIDQHLISSVDQPISALFPAYSDIFADKSKDAICLKHFLTMTAGQSWDESTYPYADSRNDYGAMCASKDPVRYVLERPLVTKPGEKYAYSTGISIALGEIIDQVSGLKANKFAERHLFEPLGISNYLWWKFPSGIVETGGGLRLRPRDMAKIGYLYLNGGQWKGKQIVSEEWVKESITNRVDAKQFPDWHKDDGYGYQWWLRSFKVGDRVIPSYHAAGRGGQFIFIVPELKIVAVFTGWNDDELGVQPFEMLERYILPAAAGEAEVAPRI
jgi:CubicO group peptidase (beta-lactamase class C family)